MYTRKQRILGTAVLLLAGAVLLPATLQAKEVELHGMVRSYTAGRITQGDVPVAEQTVDLTLEGYGDTTEITVKPYAYIDAGGEPEWGVREAYIDLFLPSMDLRIGKQAIVWGEAEGAFITDIVSPRDLRSFILADFSEIRKGVPAVKGDYFAGPFTFEAVWLPRFVPTKQPDPDSIWYTTEMAQLSGATQPAPSIENSEIFGKVSYFGPALNAELMAGYAWDDRPVLEGAATAPDAFYERYTVAGGSFSTTLASVVLRSEAAVYLNKDFTETVSPGTLGTSEHHHFHGLAGMDVSLLGIDFSSQYILQYIHDYHAALLADEYDHTATLRIRDSYLSNTLTWEFFGYVGFDPQNFPASVDTLLRPSLTYSIEDGVELQAGAELFLGSDSGNFGKYRDNSLAYLSLRWYF